MKVYSSVYKNTAFEETWNRLNVHLCLQWSYPAIYTLPSDTRLDFITCCYSAITQVHASCKLIHVQSSTMHLQVLCADITGGSSLMSIQIAYRSIDQEEIPCLMLLHAIGWRHIDCKTAYRKSPMVFCQCKLTPMGPRAQNPKPYIGNGQGQQALRPWPDKLTKFVTYLGFEFESRSIS